MTALRNPEGRQMDRRMFYDGSKEPRGKATQALTADHTTELR